MEGRNTIVITLELNRPPSQLFQVIMSSMNVTAYGECMIDTS